MTEYQESVLCLSQKIMGFAFPQQHIYEANVIAQKLLEESNIIPEHRESLERISELLTTTELVEKKIPSENQLSESLGISRPHVRDCLKILQTYDVFRSRHGSGYMVHKNTLRNYRLFCETISKTAEE